MEPSKSHGFFTPEEVEKMKTLCPLRHRAEINQIKRQAAARKGAYSKRQKAAEKTEQPKQTDIERG